MSRSSKRLVALALGVTLSVPMAAQALSFQTIINLARTAWKEGAAFAVETLQTSVASNQISKTHQNSKMQLATALSALHTSARIVDAAVSVHPDVGQPNTLKCIAQRDGKLAVEAQAQRDYDAARLMRSYTNSRVESSAQADMERLNLHRSTYCTVSESRMGACEVEPNGLQGWDVNYAAPFGQKTLAPEGELAAYAYVAMITDVRAPAVIDCSSVACATAAMHQMTAAAQGSMAASALISQVTDRRVPMLTGE